MRQPTRPITPHGVLNSLRLSLLHLRQPHGIGFLAREAFVVAWGLFNEWRETRSGRSRIDDAMAIAAEEGSRAVALPARLNSHDLVDYLLRLDCVEQRILNEQDLPREIHVEFATFAFWETGRNPEAEWRGYWAYPARLRALRSIYQARLRRTPIGQHVLEILYGSPARQEEHLDAVVRILVRKVWPLQASVHPDPWIRAQETEDTVRDYVHSSLQRIEPVPGKYWLADLLDGSVIGPEAARNKVIDRFRSVQKERRLVALEDIGAHPALQLKPEYPELQTAVLVRAAAPWIDARHGPGSATILDFYLSADVEGTPSQAAVARAVGLGSRTVWSRVQSMRQDQELRKLISENAAN